MKKIWFYYYMVHATAKVQLENIIVFTRKHTHTHLHGKALQTNYINFQRQREHHFNATPNVARQALSNKTYGTHA